MRVNSNLTASYTYKDVTLHYNKLIDVFELMHNYPELLGMIRRSTTPSGAPSVGTDVEAAGAKLFEFAISRILEVEGVDDTASPTGVLDWASLSDPRRRHVAMQIARDPEYTELWQGFIAEILQVLSVTQEEMGE